MSSTYSQSLRIELIGAGDQAGTWGTTTNNNLAYVLDSAIAGYQTVAVTSANQALTYINGSTAAAGLNESVYAMLRLTSSTGADFSIYAPPVSKSFIIYNNSGHTATIYNSTVIGNTTPAGTGLSIIDGKKVVVFSDGTNFYTIDAANLTGTLAIANGGTGQITQQAAINALTGAQSANKVLRSDGTNATLSSVVLTTDVTGTLPVTSGGTGVTTSTGTGDVVLSTSPSLVTPTISTYGNIKALFETATITAAAPASTTNFDVATQAVQYYTSNAANNFTLNIRGNSTTTLNSILAVGQSVTIALAVTNGSTAYYQTALQVDGNPVTPKWQSGYTPIAGDINSIDVYTFVVIKTASATFTVLGAQTKYA
jgi:hypothetical protein